MARIKFLISSLLLSKVYLVRYKIHIPDPCSEDPKNFSATPNGGFCHSCQKKVVDFRKMSQTEVFDFLNKNSSSRCGIFDPDQLTIPKNKIPKNVKFPSFWAFGFLGIMGCSLPMVAQASIQSPIEQIPIAPKEITKSDTAYLPKRTIKGRVISFYFNEKQALTGTRIAIKGTPKGTVADQKGYFELEVPDSVRAQKIIISLSFVGYKIKEVAVYDTQLPVQLGEIQLQEDTDFVMGEFIYIKPTLWQRFKGIFKSKTPKNCSKPNHQHA